MVAPVIPVLTDSELEQILEASAQAGARTAGYVLLRLPHEVKDLFREWLDANEPLRAKHVMSRLQDMRGGRDYDSRFSIRQRGEGEYARLLRKRFELGCVRFGLNRGPRFTHNVDLFAVPAVGPKQFSLL
jgi:DNA repair photolyase